MPSQDKPYFMILHEWAEKHLKQGQEFTRHDVLRWFQKNYPTANEGTITAQLGYMTTNRPSRIHNLMSKPGAGRDLFFQVKRGVFRLYDPSSDPTPIYLNGSGGYDSHSESVSGVPDETFTRVSSEDQTNSSAFAYEHDLQHFLVRNLEKVEYGLTPYGGSIETSIEFNAGGRRIDILAVDKSGKFVVIELKVSRGYDRALGQLSRYMAWVKQELSPESSVRGIIIAREISDDLKLATSLNPLISCFEYDISFSLNSIE